jgi:hypothetical protein
VQASLQGLKAVTDIQGIILFVSRPVTIQGALTRALRARTNSPILMQKNSVFTLTRPNLPALLLLAASIGFKKCLAGPFYLSQNLGLPTMGNIQMLNMLNIEWLESYRRRLQCTYCIARLRFRVYRINPLLHWCGGIDCTHGPVLRQPSLCSWVC